MKRSLFRLLGELFFIGDIFPDVPTLSGGEVVIFGEKRMIESGMKARNPDGTVNYDAYCYKDAYVWLRQPRIDGNYGYLASGECVGNRRTIYWGGFD